MGVKLTTPEREKIQTLSLELEEYDQRVSDLKQRLTLESRKETGSGPEGPAQGESAANLDTLLDGSFRIDCGDMFVVGDDYELSQEDRTSLEERKTSLERLVREQATKLFAEAKQQIDAIKEEQIKSKGRLAKKRKGEDGGQLPGAGGSGQTPGTGSDGQAASQGEGGPPGGKAAEVVDLVSQPEPSQSDVRARAANNKQLLSKTRAPEGTGVPAA